MYVFVIVIVVLSLYILSFVVVKVGRKLNLQKGTFVLEVQYATKNDSKVI